MVRGAAGCECRAPSESEESSNVQYLPMAIAWRRQDAGARRGSRADERLTWVRTAGIGAQHVIAMFGATFLVPILTGFDRPPPCSSRLCPPHCSCLSTGTCCRAILGSSFGFIAPITAVSTANKGIAVASFGIMVTGILLALVGVLVHYAGSKWIDIIMPPVVNGADRGHHRLQSGTFRVDQLPSRARHRTGYPVGRAARGCAVQGLAGFASIFWSA